MQQADYRIAVKENQPTLWHDVQAAFEPTTRDHHSDDAHLPNKDHSRLDIRRCWSSGDAEDVAFIDDYKQWSGLRTFVKVQSKRPLPDQTEQIRYFISSLPPDARRLLVVACAHWQIENGMHWVLDIAFP